MSVDLSHKDSSKEFRILMMKLHPQKSDSSELQSTRSIAISIHTKLIQYQIIDQSGFKRFYSIIEVIKINQHNQITISVTNSDVKTSLLMINFAYLDQFQDFPVGGWWDWTKPYFQTFHGLTITAC